MHTDRDEEAAEDSHAIRAQHPSLSDDVDALRRQLRAREGPEDYAHLRKLERWGRSCTAAGYATAWLAPNPVSAVLISLGIFARWTIVNHAVSHRAYDRIPSVPARYTSRVFARGWRRWVDWFDWIVPAAWHHEHDVLHHYRLGEADDPDQLEINSRWLRQLPLSPAWRRAVVFGLALVWKPAYYAPNTLKELRFDAARRRGEEPRKPRLMRAATYHPAHPEGRDLWLRSYLPYVGFRFVVLPALAAPLGGFAVASVLVNSLVAELLTNLHTFAVIAPNHTGGDVPRFEGTPADRDAFYARQIEGSVNYRCGGDGVNFLHGWLNYQIEHHLFPDLPLRQYAWAQPRVRALCQRHGLAYKQEPVMRRLARAVDVMVGRDTMPQGDDPHSVPPGGRPSTATARVTTPV